MYKQALHRHFVKTSYLGQFVFQPMCMVLHYDDQIWENDLSYNLIKDFIIERWKKIIYWIFKFEILIWLTLSLSKFAQICRNLFKFVETCSNLSKLVQICSFRKDFFAKFFIPMMTSNWKIWNIFELDPSLLITQVLSKGPLTQC